MDSSSLALPSHFPIDLSVSSANGSWIHDLQGRSYLDMIAGIAVSPLGHGHPEVLNALREQLDRHLHVMVYGEYRQEVQTRFAEDLTSLLPLKLNKAFLVNSGTEANEAALKLAKAYTGRSKVLSFEGSYHGSTHGSLSLSDNEERKNAFRPLLPGTERLPFDEPDSLKRIDDRSAAVFLETVQGDAGVRIPSSRFMKAIRDRCNETGALLVLDEIQCGLGRTGKWWAFQHYGIEPDILTSAKALGGGLPLGAIVSNEKILRSFQEDPPLGHITSTGGHPLSCRAGSAMIEAMRAENTLDPVEEKGAKIEHMLKHSRVLNIRRKGLMIGFDLEDEESAKRSIKKAREKGVLVFGFLSHPEGIRIAPPLNSNDEDLEKGCERIRKALDEL